jgi:hypothetical protein
MLVALVALFVVLGGVAVANTGRNFILGQSNTANQTTSPELRCDERADAAGGKRRGKAGREVQRE